MGNRAESQDLIDLGNRIRKRRQEIHLSQEVLAEKTGISPNTISRIEGGQTAMSIEIFRKLAVILKKDSKDVALEDVEDYIFGYTIMNDVSAREVQTAHRQWYFGKSLDGFTPLGPWIVTADSVEFPPKLRIQSRVNGELRQDSNTEQFIHGIAEVVSELSRGMTLKAGTIIATGTPAGVGMGFDPPRFLKPGDVVECVIEGIGTLKNPVVE